MRFHKNLDQSTGIWQDAWSIAYSTSKQRSSVKSPRGYKINIPSWNCPRWIRFISMLYCSQNKINLNTQITINSVYTHFVCLSYGQCMILWCFCLIWVKKTRRENRTQIIQTWYFSCSGAEREREREVLALFSIPCFINQCFVYCSWASFAYLLIFTLLKPLGFKYTKSNRISFSNLRTRSTKEKRLHTTILSDIYNGAMFITTCSFCVLQYTPRTPSPSSKNNNLIKKKKKKQQKLSCFGNRWALAKHIENIFYIIIQDCEL